MTMTILTISLNQQIKLNLNYWIFIIHQDLIIPLHLFQNLILEILLINTILEKKTVNQRRKNQIINLFLELQ